MSISENPAQSTNCGKISSVKAPSATTPLPSPLPYMPRKESVSTVGGQMVKHGEGDYGPMLSDDPPTDDSLNIYPKRPAGNTTSPEQQAVSDKLVTEPTHTSETNNNTPPTTTPTPVSCSSVIVPVSDSFQLTPNFSVGDLSFKTALSKVKVRAQHGYSVQAMVCNLQAWAENIGEPLAAYTSRSKMLITSGFRLGSSTSQHEKGMAADIQFPSKSWTEMYNLAIWIKENLPFDQLILEYGRSPWIHVSFNRFGNRPPSASNKFGTKPRAGNYIWGTLKNMYV